MSFTKDDGTYVGKKRTAHNEVTKDRTVKPVAKTPRPKIPIEYGAKVPQNVRQKYLDKFIDELLPKMETEQEAFDKVKTELT